MVEKEDSPQAGENPPGGGLQDEQEESMVDDDQVGIRAGASGVREVSKYQAAIEYSNGWMSLGEFSTYAEAVTAYQVAFAILGRRDNKSRPSPSQERIQREQERKKWHVPVVTYGAQQRPTDSPSEPISR
jgi:hypothetical protein